MALPRFSNSQIHQPRSHYQFKNWRFSDDKNRLGAVPVVPIDRKDADLISTAVFNPKKKTQTVLTMGIDIDLKRTGAQWLNHSKVDWTKVADYLSKCHRPIYDAIDCVVMSTTGSGFHLLIGIQPLEISGNPRQYFYQWRAETVQRRLIKLLNQEGIGADPAAIGLLRDYPNHFRNDRILFGSAMSLTASQRFTASDKIKALDTYLESVGYPKKEKKVAFFGEARIAQGIASLYLFIAESFLEGDHWMMLPLAQIQKITGASAPFLRKLLKNPPDWLLAEWCGKGEGWKLGIKDHLKLLGEARKTVESPQSCHREKSNYVDLCPPEDVQDGERNAWITRLAIHLKHAGVIEFQAMRFIGDAVQRIPNYGKSRNCKSYLSIVASIYRNQPSLFGCRKNIDLPNWLNEKTSTEKKTNPIEGDGVPRGCCRRFDGGLKSEPLEKKSREWYQNQGVWGPSPITSVAISDPLSAKSAEVFDFLSSIAPEAAREIKARHSGAHSKAKDSVLEIAKKTELQIEPLKLEFTSSQPLRSLKLSEQRGIDFSSRHPMDRFLSTYERCSKSQSSTKILKVLEEIYAISHKIRYNDIPPGPFKRIIQAYIVLPKKLRSEVLLILREEILKG